MMLEPPEFYSVDCPECEDRDPDEEYETCSLCNGTGYCHERDLERHIRDERRLCAAEAESEYMRHG